MPRVVVFDVVGGPDVLHIVDEPVVEPGPGEVRVRIEAFAVNPLDIMARAGVPPMQAPLPHARLGVEGTGVIDAVGAGVDSWGVGDPVILTAVPDAHVRGSYAEYTTVPANQVMARPAGLGVVESAAVWVAYSTAYGALFETAGMRPADRILVTAASGGVGRAAIQIANQIGAVPIAVTRRAAAVDELLVAGAGAVVATDREDLVEATRRHTDGAGADITLDLVTGPGQRDLVEATRRDGVLVPAGFLDARPTPQPADRVRVTDRYRSFEHTTDPVVVRRMAAFLTAGVRLGALTPAVGAVFDLADVVDAHRYLESGRRSGGKVVVTV
ncbi:zinc-dependent alcohol dehydrogenase family protein [Promicromonospora sp. NPDC059942]|uniref:zinc-dependent alcohol dehydrogenase family protein n=1 Tax=Promicromonospora sp. NPDC059942 TaxID=3347009 RepID=UPI00364B56AF